MTDTIEIYGDSISGNCYKLQLACAQLGIDYIWHELDILAGDARTESNAILGYLPAGACRR